MVAFLEVFSKYGVPGLVIGLQFVWIWRLENRYKALSDAYKAETDNRVKDAQEYTKMALDLQEKVIKAVATIGRALDESNGLDKADGIFND